MVPESTSPLDKTASEQFLSTCISGDVLEAGPDPPRELTETCQRLPKKRQPV